MKTHIIIYFWALIFIATSCGTIHEYPDCEDDIDIAKLSLTFEFNKDDIDQIIHNPLLKKQPLAWRADRQARYTLEIHRESDDVQVAKEYIYATDFIDGEVSLNLELPVEDYYALAWADYIMLNNKNDLFYKTQWLKDITLLHPMGYDKSKEQFSGKKEIALKETNTLPQTEVITMHRPGGKFRIIATDYGEFLSLKGRKPSTVAYGYHKSVYDKFNVYDDTPSNLIDAVPLVGEITEFSDTECIVALDWVVLKKEGATVEVSFIIYDDKGDVINEVPPIQFPMRRDVLTIVKGRFLTHVFDGDGGIGVDDEFEEEIEIILPDL